MLVGVLSLACFAPAAFAHPHVWIDSQATMIFSEHKITSIRMVWIFDDMFSLTVMDQFDHNHDRRFFDQENDEVRDNAFVALADIGFLTYLRRNEEVVKVAGFHDFVADITDDGRVKYSFTLDLAEPVDPVADQIGLSVYDSEFFIDVGFAQKDPILFSGNDGLTCSYKMGEDDKHRIYFDMVSPQRADITCQ
ncbi:ABC transporter [Thalassospira marina]|uniref:ABC transporter n=2 Tax=Thalassospira marina TaxID=2048283 RepID=A0A2N3L0D8_9PROT|nr:ABC transporter [Thalassospira marina]PKR56258.1 ABC transporter [Thalassospira marina]